MSAHRLPKYCIVDVKHLLDPWRNTGFWFFQRLPVEKLVEAFTSIPVYNDCNEAVWSVVDMHLADISDQLSGNDIDTIQLNIEVIMEHFYQELDRILGDAVEHYVFDHWIPQDGLVFVLCS